MGYFKYLQCIETLASIAFHTNKKTVKQKVSTQAVLRSILVHRLKQTVMAKLTLIKKKSVNSFSGIWFCYKKIVSQRIPELIQRTFGDRPQQAKFSFSDSIISWLCCNLCGGTRLTDVIHLKRHFKGMPDIKMPSHDMLGRIFKTFATDSIKIMSKSNIEHTFNINMKLNRLMLDIALKVKAIKPKADNVLDYDNVVLKTEKKDSTWTYKGFNGYQPGYAFIGATPVYIEGRSGHSPASFELAATLARCFDLLREKGVKIKTFRSDAAAYQKDVVELCESKGIEFFIRVNNSKLLRQKVADHKEWDTVRLGKVDFDICEMTLTPFGGEKSYRIIITRYVGKKGTNYRAIMTDNMDMTKEEVLAFYNMRGAIERNFDELGNSFNMKNLAFSYLHENTAYMLIGAICSILYKYILKKLSNKLDFLRPSIRLKRFIFLFISVSGEWDKIKGEDRLTLYTDKPYDLLE